MCLRKTIPRTDFLTDVTTKDPILKIRLKGCWKLIFEFYGKIGNALGAVHLIGRDGLGGAGINAAGTSSTEVFNGAIDR